MNSFKAFINRLKSNQYFKIFTNFYIVVSLFFIIWMLFIDTNSYLFHNTLSSEINELIIKKEQLKKEIVNDTDFVTSLLENTGVAVVQGSAFGKEGYFRISYATSLKNLSKALDKIEEYCKQLS